MKKKTRAATAAELEAILEQLMLEVANSYPVWEYINSGDSEPSVKNWAHMTAMYVSEVLKRRSSDRDTIIKKAKKAVRRRIERELADSYLGMELPSASDEASESSPEYPTKASSPDQK
jgi:hypothetical protein